MGYWYTVKTNRRMIEEMRDERGAMGRPMVIVYAGAERLVELQLAVENVDPGPAKGISLEFSAPFNPLMLAPRSKHSSTSSTPWPT